MGYEAMWRGQRPELRNLSFARDADIPALMHDRGTAVTNGTHLGLHRYSRPSDATPMERFKVISSADEPFSLYAKMEMERLGIDQGDMLDLEKRYVNTAWTEQNMTRGDEGNQTSSMKPMKVTNGKAETKVRARTAKMRRRGRR
jgi:hypothetical protein